MYNITKPFVYVEDDKIESFKTKYINYENEIPGETDKYNNNIVFLGSTGEIFTHSQIYGGKDSLNKYILTSNDDNFIFADKNGNVIAKIDDNGIRSVGLYDIDNNKYYTSNEIDKKFDNIQTYTYTTYTTYTTTYTASSDSKYILNSESDTFYFTDKDGHVVTKINEDGIQSVAFFDINGNEITYNQTTSNTAAASTTNRFTNKHVFSLCDSLGSGGGWQTTFCSEVGAKPFNQELNGGAELKTQGLTLSCGGAATLHKITFGWDGRPDGLTSGQQRAINFVKQSTNLYGDKDYLFLENINDFNFFGDECTDEMIADPSLVDPVMVEETYVYDGQIFSTQVGARDFFYANTATVLNDITPGVNKAITLKCGSKKFKFTIANAATQDGIITITINGQEYIEQVLVNTSISDIATQLYAINFVGYDNSKTDDILSITANTVAATDYTVTVTNTCGCNITVEQESTTGNWSAVFTSHDVNDWLDTTKWETNITSMRAIMGLIEYLEQKLPKTHLIYILMPRFPFKYDTYKKADGTPDEHTYRNLDIIKKFERFLKMQKAVCEFYNLEYIDLAHTMGWNYNNMYTWFGNGTIHWNAYAHEYIGKFLANKLA